MSMSLQSARAALRLALVCFALAAISLTASAALATPFVVNEVLTDPKQDWNDTAGGGTAFDATPGNGTIGSTDEYIELKNVSGSPQSLEGWALEMIDGSDAFDCFDFGATVLPAPATCVTGTNTVYRVFDSSGVEVTAGAISDRLKAVPAGGYVVIGDPDGNITNGTTATPTVIRLRNTLNDGDDSNDVIVDTISITGNAESAMDESVSRFPDGADSGVDTNDLVKRSGTLGASNGSLCSVAAGDAVINEVVTDPQHDWDQDGSSTPFDGTMGVGSVNAHDEYVEIKNTSANPMNLEGCVLRFEDGTDERLVLQAADAVPTPSYTSYIRVFSAMGVLQGTAPALTNVEPGGYVVLGDPPGEMNNDSTLSLYSDVLVDTVDFGGDAPNLNAGDAEDESGSRVPDGADTGVGADDFKKQRATLGASNELDECTLALDDCDTNASCSNTAAGFDCTCNAGYEGDGSTGGSGCSDIDECSDGTDDCHANATCTNEIASFSCACNSGFSGDGKTCTDIDECATGADNCDQNAACSNTAGSFNCICNAGYSGSGATCNDINECSTGAHDCHQNATCTNEDASFSCACNSGYSGNGKTCDDIDECADGNHDCDPNASCSNVPGGFTCECNTGFNGDGKSCQSNIGGSGGSGPIDNGATQNGVETDSGGCVMAHGRSRSVHWSWALALAGLGLGWRRRRAGRVSAD
jgi:hypothetical protein